MIGIENILTNIGVGNPQLISNIIIRFFGILGLVLTVLSFQQNTKKGILTFQLFSTLSFLIQFTLLGSPAGAILNLIGTIRSITYSFKGKNKFTTLPILPAIMISFAVCTFFMSYQAEGIRALLPCIAMILTSVSMWLSKPKYVRIISLPSDPLWFIYNMLSGSYEGMVTEVFVMLSIIIGIISFDIGRNKNASNEEKANADVG